MREKINLRPEVGFLPVIQEIGDLPGGENTCENYSNQSEADVGKCNSATKFHPKS
jgi:hypothetical protein